MTKPPAVSRANLELQAGRQATPASEATSIEQSRAIAQVQGALIVAQQRPRDVIRATQRMREACSSKGLAEHAFFSYRRGGSTVSGPSVHLARELARCWGNVDYGTAELRRDALAGQSEMLAYAWDLETNTNNKTTFIVPHLRDKTGGPVELPELRDVFENNANNAARRLRECILAVLPKDFVEEAKELCRATLEKGDGEPIGKRREKVVEAFAGLGISRARVERRIGSPADQLTPLDLANLGVLWRAIRNGELDADEEFPEIAGETVARALKGGKPAATEHPATAHTGPTGDAGPAAGRGEPRGGEPAEAAASPPASSAAPDTTAPAASGGSAPATATEGAAPATEAAPAAAAPAAKPTAPAAPAWNRNDYVVPIEKNGDGTYRFRSWADAWGDRLPKVETATDLDRLNEVNLDLLDACDDQAKPERQKIARYMKAARERLAGSAQG